MRRIGRGAVAAMVVAVCVIGGAGVMPNAAYAVAPPTVTAPQVRVAGAPVNAQARVSFGWGIYVTYNRTEVKRIAALPIAKVKYGALLCAPIAQPTLALACGLYVYDAASAVAATFRSAARQSACVQTRYATPSTIIGWNIVRC